jgi:ferredoxin
VQLDAEVYYLHNDTALMIAGYLADHRNAAFGFRLVLAPSLTDLALRRYSGKAYVLGRWQGSFFRRTVAPSRARRIRGMKRALDPAWNLNRGSYFCMGLLGIPGRAASLGFLPLVRTLGALMGSTLALPFVWSARTVFSLFPGPGSGRGRKAQQAPAEADGTFRPQTATQRAIGCVNCGECNSVCPIFWHSAIRLPQMLTHLGERVAQGKDPGRTGSALLDLCLRCGNCEEVCQAGIPHLPLYEFMQQASDRARPRDRDRHLAVLETVRTSASYQDDFLGLRKGGYKKRVPAALPGLVRFIVQRAETEDGAAATCIHCGACVPVCPTNANLDFRETDARLITTDQTRCIGCGTCVEVCPANLANGGQTLRVFEAPTEEFLATASEILATLERSGSAAKKSRSPEDSAS